MPSPTLFFQNYIYQAFHFDVKSLVSLLRKMWVMDSRKRGGGLDLVYVGLAEIKAMACSNIISLFTIFATASSSYLPANASNAA